MNDSLSARARAVLLTADPVAKVFAARALARDWRAGRLAHRFDAAMPDTPARLARPELLPASRMPKRGRAGSVATRIAMLHALAHIELNALDLAIDCAGRFGSRFPRAFTDDWIAVAADEALHFAAIRRRLRALGAAYGDLPAHDGLWEAALATAHDARARLAVVPMVLEARGLDVTPAMIARFAAAGDQASAAVLRRILADEIRHVGTGVRWFEAAEKSCATQRFADGGSSPSHWRRLVETHFGGRIKPPFNDSARAAAGLTQDYYAPLARAEPVYHKASARPADGGPADATTGR